MDRCSSLGTATPYSLEGPGIECRWRRIFRTVQTVPGTHTSSYTIGTWLFPVVKQPESGVDHTPPSSAEDKERVELYIYSPSGPSWPVLWWPLPLRK